MAQQGTSLTRFRIALLVTLCPLAACGGATSPTSHTIEPTVGTSQISLTAPEDLLFDPAGNLYISDFSGDVIVKRDPTGALSLVAGTGITGYSGDEGPALDAKLDSPTGMAFDADGNFVFADHDNGCIRRIDGTGVITTIAGRCGHVGFSGDDGPATRALLNDPIGMAFDRAGDLYFGDEQNGRVRRIDRRGVITTIAGGGSRPAAEGTLATQVRLSHPSYVLFGDDGTLYFSDFGANSVWAIDPAGKLSVVAGNGKEGYAGDGGLAVDSELSWPTGLAFDADGNLYISDANNNVVRRVGTDGIVTTVAGTGDVGSSGDGGPASDAELNASAGLAFDADGNLYIADQGNGLIRRVDSKTGIITTVIGAA